MGSLLVDKRRVLFIASAGMFQARFPFDPAVAQTRTVEPVYDLLVGRIAGSLRQAR
jgi:hypothetical protein